MLAIALLASALACQPSGAATGNPQEPPETLGARDVVADFKLPPLLDGPGDTVWTDEQATQVLARAKLLGINENTATEAWAQVQSTLQQAQPCRETIAQQIGRTEFHGTSASDLNKLLQESNVTSVAVTSAQILIDTPILLDRENLDIDFGRTELLDVSGRPYMIRVEGAKNVTLRGGLLSRGNWGVLIADSSHITADKMTMSGLAGGGIVVTNSSDVNITMNRFRGLAHTPVLLQGNTQAAKVIHNEITGNLGESNWDAGVVLTDRNLDVADDPYSVFSVNSYSPPEQPMTTQLSIPQNNLIAYNHIEGNESSGMYSDGSIGNVFVNNQVENNAKEGMCLDYGSSADVVAFNLFRGNGKRWGQTDAVLKLDAVFQYGRLPDGTSPAKLPGISIDNAVYNQVVFNEVDGNYGSGIKTVRTAFYNLIGDNTVTGNNLGQSVAFHFFGIELGFAAADSPSTELDFAPSRGNVVFANTIRGAHYSGIFFEQGSDQNNLFDNTIFNATTWGMESVIVQANITLNNLTNLGLRNVTSGLSPSFCASH